ncbi:MAG: hypothetical protein H7Z14_10725 [Anaerolineae bacterium]|nr:hypothetical protein [Phycisphaerae bacterium]
MFWRRIVVVNYRKIFLVAFICSLAAAAGIGVFGIVSSRYGDGHLLATMASIALFSLTALGSAIVLDKRKWRIAMMTSFGVSAVGLCLFLVMIYLRRGINSPYDQYLTQAMGLSATLAVAMPLGGLLAMTRFEQSGFRFVRIASIAMVFIAAGIICLGIIAFDNLNSDYPKLLGVAVILAALGTICLPVLHKIAGMPPPCETVASDLLITVICPRCSLSQPLTTGESRCAQCRLRFVIEVEEPRCPKCRYLLYQLTEPRCPECGTPVDNSDILTPANTPAV